MTLNWRGQRGTSKGAAPIVGKLPEILKAPTKSASPNSDVDAGTEAAEPVNPFLQSHARSKASQGKGWSSVLNVAKRFYAANPDDHISTLLCELRELNISRKDPARYYRDKELVQPLGYKVLEENSKDKTEAFYYQTVRDGKYSIGNISPIRYLSKLIRRDTTGIFELGSGWGSNLFQLYVVRGKSQSKSIIYYGGEYTREGQICAKYIASKEPDMNFRSFTFDYRDPNLTFLERQRGHILIFTSHSIEQVDVINPVLFDQLRSLKNPVTVVHFEPVGWQRIPRLMMMREGNDAESFEELGARAVAGDTSSVTDNAAWWSWRLHYNKNLLGILSDLQREHAIKMAHSVYDFDAVGNIFNPSTLLHYDFVR